MDNMEKGFVAEEKARIRKMESYKPEKEAPE